MGYVGESNHVCLNGKDADHERREKGGFDHCCELPSDVSVRADRRLRVVGGADGRDDRVRQTPRRPRREWIIVSIHP